MAKKIKPSELTKEIAKAKKDPKFLKDINQFIKITSGVYKLKQYGMEKL